MKISVRPFLFLTLCLASCASMFNGRTHRVTVRTNLAADSLKIGNTKVRVRKGEGTLKVTRNIDSLSISVPGRDTVYAIQIKSRNSFHYLMGAICTAGLTTIVEWDNPKRYYYQKNIYISEDEQGIRIFRFPPTPKGSLRIHLSFPYLNYFYIATTTNHKNHFGFLGVTTGVDYFYKDNSFVSFTVGGAMDNPVGFPVGVDYFGEYERANCLFVNATHSHIKGSFEFGYGLNASRYLWYKGETRNPGKYEEKKNAAFGFNLNSNYRITKNFHVGLLYQSSIFTIDNGWKFDYQHLLSIELIFKFGMKR